MSAELAKRVAALRATVAEAEAAAAARRDAEHSGAVDVGLERILAFDADSWSRFVAGRGGGWPSEVDREHLAHSVFDYASEVPETDLDHWVRHRTWAAVVHRRWGAALARRSPPGLEALTSELSAVHADLLVAWKASDTNDESQVLAAELVDWETDARLVEHLSLITVHDVLAGLVNEFGQDAAFDALQCLARRRTKVASLLGRPVADDAAHLRAQLIEFITAE